MEIVFDNAELSALYQGKKPIAKQYRSNPELVRQFLKTIGKLKALERIEQVYQFHSLNYEKLVGNRINQSSVRINKQYRLIFQEELDDSDPPRVILLRIEEISNHYK